MKCPECGVELKKKRYLRGSSRSVRNGFRLDHPEGNDCMILFMRCRRSRGGEATCSAVRAQA